METIANALLPLVVLLLSGLALRRSGFLEKSFWDQAENLTYYFLMPVMLVRTIASSQLVDIPWADMVLVVYGTTITSAVVLGLAYFLLRNRLDAPLFTSVFQGSVRFNTYIALALVESIYGAVGVASGGLIAGFLIVIINVLCISFMSTVLHTGRPSPTKIIRELVKNPLIIACLLGGAINYSGIFFAVWVDASLALIARMALPIALLCVGASLSLRRLKGDLTPALMSSLFQFVLKPLLAFGLAKALGLSVMATTIVVIFMAVPTAVSAYILARKLGGDQDTMATIITFQTLAAFATLTITLSLLQVYA